MKLSVIICVYNTKIEYFESCLKSLRSESCGEDIEICVLDDGSSIDYSELVQKYRLKYKRTENRGILAARLSAVEMASGDYIAFCDSDDTVSFDFHRPMVECAEREGADIVINDWAFHTDKSRYFCKQDITIKEDFALEGREIIEKFFEPGGRHHSLFVLWNKVFSGAVLRRAAEAVSWSELNRDRCIYSEDAAICFFAFLYAGRLRNVHTGYYFYRVHSEQTVSVISSDRLALQITYMAKTLNIMENVLRKEGLSQLLGRLDEWRGLMSRNHYSHARAKGYTELYGLIKNSYRTKRLRTSGLADGYVYTVNTLLPENFVQVDAALREIYCSKAPITVCCKPRSRYAIRQLCRFILEGHSIKLSDSADITVPKDEISLRNKFLHNFFVYTTGTLLFPKGSRLREFLKAKL